ncbi:MAG TPA: chromate resistance protein ChrB domain-containing protein [Burkholderiales bacterium]|nr:chromate resistance protein ChrB domain-containing protein [Burkholderiales bacterium]
MSTPMFLALLTSLPTGNSALRMRVWRALKGSGCGVLRDGVYLLPAETPRSAALAEAELEVKAAGGFAMTVELNLKTSAQLEHVRRLFDRGEEYASLLARIGAARVAMKRLGKRKTDTLVQRLQRSFEELAEVDFYPGQALLQAKDAMSGLEGEARRLYPGGEPHPSNRKLRRLDPAKFRNRTWATRKDLWVDRLACIWLVRRFIDRNARFAWIDRPRDRPKASVGFDFDGAEFTHAGSRVTFEVLIGSFGLDGDPALASIGHAVHFLDIGGIPAADAKGLETMLRGIKAKAGSDDETALEAAKVFDLFYLAYAQKR